MLLSMTGYGKSAGEFNNKTIIVEIRSLNSKQADVNLKIPQSYREKELEIRNQVVSKLQRGKIELLVYVEQPEKDKGGIINPEIFANYATQLRNLAQTNNLVYSDAILPAILRMSDVLKSEKEEFNDDEYATLSEIVSSALEMMMNFRKQEGNALEKDIKTRIDLIGSYLDAIVPFEKMRLENVRARIKNNMNEIGLGDKVDLDRFEQELIYYLEKIDITEEKVRLANHLLYFIETMESPDGVGKKLGFISQEIGREINTIGSKASDVDIQKLVVQMKDELEKIKEQLMNVL